MLGKIKIIAVVVVISLFYCFCIGMVLRNTNAVPALSQPQNGVKLPIIMYHSILKDKSQSGKYVVTPAQLESDIEYLKSNGYTFVSAQEIIDYAEGGATLPEKPVMLTFDDGHFNFYGYVVPILEKTGAKAVVSIVGSYTDEYSESNIKNMSYGYMRWSEVYDMFLSNRVEVGNHSYDFHSTNRGRNGSKKNKNESMAQYELLFRQDTEKAQNRCMTKTGFEPVIYTYPFGAYTEETTDWLKEMGFKITFSCTEGVNIITRDPNSLFLLMRYNRPSGISSEKYFAKVLGD